jgi:tetratricopeptide (TPR) repeat protein
LAIEQVKAVLAEKPGHYRAQVLKAMAYHLKGDFKKAREAYTHATRLRPDDPTAYYQLAKLDRHDHRYGEATANLDKVLTLKPDHVPALAAKVSLYMAQEQQAKALSLLDKQIQQHKNNPMLAAVCYEMRGSVMAAQKKYDQSEADFEKALELNSNLVAPYLSLARLYLAKDETTKAIAQYQQILEKRPKFIQARMALGAIYDAEGKTAEAQNMYEKALEINPSFAPAANNLAWLLLQQDQDPDRALSLAKKAKAQLPDDPSVADTYALALIVKGLYTSAISELSDATEKMPQNPTVLYHLGLAYWKNGDTNQAAEALGRALKLEQVFPERQAAMELLQEARAQKS